MHEYINTLFIWVIFDFKKNNKQATFEKAL